ncbi:MAG TPA: hypothetical protein PK440_11820 [Candidatus Accumulibacter phosphatis]|nr:hypothetical protein [Candidatus Accumulibacter phosphatis]HRQ95665.1 hypothetical protein [Candidatus Accumulibacter phosphatis]
MHQGQAIRSPTRHSRTVARARACDPRLRNRPAELSRALLDGEHGYADGEVRDFGHRYSVIDRIERLPKLFMALTRQANGSDHWPMRRSLCGWRTGRAGACASHGPGGSSRSASQRRSDRTAWFPLQPLAVDITYIDALRHTCCRIISFLDPIYTFYGTDPALVLAGKGVFPSPLQSRPTIRHCGERT